MLTISSQVIVLALSRAGGQAMLLVVFALMARSIGIDRFGQVTLAVGIAAALSGITDFGAGSFWIREFSAGRLPKSALARRSAGKIVLGSMISALLLGIGILKFRTELLSLAGCILFSSVVSQTHQALLIAAGENLRLSVYSFFERVGMVSIYLGVTRYSTLRPEVALGFGYVGGALVLAILTSCRLPGFRPNYREMSLKETWKGSAYYGMSTTLVSLQSLDVLIGSAVGGWAVAGAYGAVSRWTTPIALVTNAFATLLNPIAAGAKDRSDLWRKIRGALWLPAASVAVAALMAILAEPFVLHVLGRQFCGSIPILRWLALAAALSTCSQVAVTILQSRRRERAVARSLMFAVALQLALVVPLVDLLGASGLAIASVAGQVVLLAILASKTGMLLLRK